MNGVNCLTNGEDGLMKGIYHLTKEQFENKKSP